MYIIRSDELGICWSWLLGDAVAMAVIYLIMWFGGVIAHRLIVRDPNNSSQVRAYKEIEYYANGTTYTLVAILAILGVVILLCCLITTAVAIYGWAAENTRIVGWGLLALVVWQVLSYIAASILEKHHKKSNPS